MTMKKDQNKIMKINSIFNQFVRKTYHVKLCNENLYFITPFFRTFNVRVNRRKTGITAIYKMSFVISGDFIQIILEIKNN